MYNTTVLRQLIQFCWHLLSDDLRTTVEVVGECFDELCDTVETIRLQIFPQYAIIAGSLPDFERDYNCPTRDDELTTRRNRVVAAIRARGGLNKKYFVGIAQGLGYVIGSTGEKYLNFTEGLYAPFRADISRADIDRVYDGNGGYSKYSVIVTGTDVETDLDLQRLFNKQGACGVTFIYSNV